MNIGKNLWLNALWKLIEGSQHTSSAAVTSDLNIKQSSPNQELTELINNKQWTSDQVTALTYSVYINIIFIHLTFW